MIAHTEMPQMLDASHSHTIYNAAAMHTPLTSVVAHGHSFAPLAVGAVNQLTEGAIRNAGFGSSEAVPPNAEVMLRQLVGQQSAPPKALPPIPKPQGAQAVANPPALRVVKIFIADTDTNVPLIDRLLHKTEEMTTDLTDQELFYDIPIRELLEKHNAKRAKLYNKANKERTEMLEPIRIRDLKMTVVTIAGF